MPSMSNVSIKTTLKTAVIPILEITLPVVEYKIQDTTFIYAPKNTPSFKFFTCTSYHLIAYLQ